MTERIMPLEGGCACREVRFTVTGPHRRAGLCHCRTCQRAHAAPYFAFVIFDAADVRLVGPVAVWQSSPDYGRAFCTGCGSRVASFASNEIELCMTQFDDPTAFTPSYESWTIRRQPWVKPLDVIQFSRDREP